MWSQGESRTPNLKKKKKKGSCWQYLGNAMWLQNGIHKSLGHWAAVYLLFSASQKAVETSAYAMGQLCSRLLFIKKVCVKSSLLSTSIFEFG